MYAVLREIETETDRRQMAGRQRERTEGKRDREANRERESERGRIPTKLTTGL